MKTQNPAPNPAPKRFTQLSISKIQSFKKVERWRLQKGTHRYVVTSCGEIAGFLMPVCELGTIQPIKKYTEVTITDFRNGISSLWGLLLSGFDCIYITAYNRRIFAFVSPKLVTAHTVIDTEKKHGLSIQNS